MPRKKVTKAAVLAAEKKYLDQDGLAHLVQKNDARYVRKEDGVCSISINSRSWVSYPLLSRRCFNFR